MIDPRRRRMPRRTSLTMILISFAALCVVAVLGVFVLSTSQRVQDQEAVIADQNGKVLAEQERIRILRAEWAHLTSPARLERVMRESGAQGEGYDPDGAPAATGYDSVPEPEVPATPDGEVAQ